MWLGHLTKTLQPHQSYQENWHSSGCDPSKVSADNRTSDSRIHFYMTPKHQILENSATYSFLQLYLQSLWNIQWSATATRYKQSRSEAVSHNSEWRQLQQEGIMWVHICIVEESQMLTKSLLRASAFRLSTTIASLTWSYPPNSGALYNYEPDMVYIQMGVSGVRVS